MKYGRVLSDAWKALWKSGGLWGFQATFLGAYALLFGGSMGAMFAWFASWIDGPEPDPTMFLGAFALFGLLGLLAIPAYWIFHGGSIHLTNEALEGRPTRYGDGWKAGFRRLGAVAGFELLLWGVMAALYAVLFGVFFGVVFGAAASGGDSGAAAALGGVCCFYVIFFALVMVAAVIVQAFEAVGARAAVLSGRGGMQSFGDAWQALRGRFKHMALMGLIMVGLSYAWSLVTSIVLVPLQFLSMPGIFQPDFNPESSEIFSMFGLAYFLIIVASILLTYPFTVYLYMAWTAFYRQLVGLTPAEDYAATPAAPVYPGIAPPPPAPPGQPVSAIPPAPAPPGATHAGEQDGEESEPPAARPAPPTGMGE